MKTLLVIEDNDELRENTAELLGLNGYAVHMAKNGDEGYSQAIVLNPSLILCDVMMPESDGLSFLKRAKASKILSHIPVVLFSAGSLPGSLKRAFALGATAYLNKPFTEEELMVVVNQFII